MARESLERPGTRRVGRATLAFALASLAEIEFHMGDWRSAYASAVESLHLAHASDRVQERMHGLARLALVEAGLGRDDACRRHGEQALAIASSVADDHCKALSRSALGLLELGLGRIDAAVTRLEPLTREGFASASYGAADLAEALIRRGDHERATDLLNALAASAAVRRVCAQRRALDRCRGLLAADDNFEAHFAQALDSGPHLVEPFEQARTQLCFGQRLRRAGRRVAARKRLLDALGTFDRLGAAPWAQSTRHELGARTAAARKRANSTRDELTPRSGRWPSSWPRAPATARPTKPDPRRHRPTKNKRGKMAPTALSVATGARPPRTGSSVRNPPLAMLRFRHASSTERRIDMS
jgi:hypothetical protein